MKDKRGNMKEKEILKLIEKSKKDYDKNVQRAELLARNEIFLTELRKINKYISKEFRCLLRQLLLLNRRPRKLLSTDSNSQKHGKPPKKDCHCRENFPKDELFFNQPGLHRRCPYFIPEF